MLCSGVKKVERGERSIAAMVLLVAAVLSMVMALAAPGYAGSRPAPEFEIVTFSGESFSRESLNGHPALLIFWAPWCKVCQRELPLLAAYSKNGKPADLRMISIGFADVRSNVEGFVKARPETFVFPTAYDEDRWVAQAFKITATPTFVVLDRHGDVALVHRGGGLLESAEFQTFLGSLKE